MIWDLTQAFFLIRLNGIDMSEQQNQESSQKQGGKKGKPPGLRRIGKIGSSAILTGYAVATVLGAPAAVREGAEAARGAQARGESRITVIQDALAYGIVGGIDDLRKKAEEAYKISGISGIEGIAEKYRTNRALDHEPAKSILKQMEEVRPVAAEFNFLDWNRMTKEMQEAMVSGLKGKDILLNIDTPDFVMEIRGAGSEHLTLALGTRGSKKLANTYIEEYEKEPLSRRSDLHFLLPPVMLMRANAEQFYLMQKKFNRGSGDKLVELRPKNEWKFYSRRLVFSLPEGTKLRVTPKQFEWGKRGSPNEFDTQLVLQGFTPPSK